MACAGVRRDHAPQRPPRPWVYFCLFLPYGAGSAYVSVTIGALEVIGLGAAATKYNVLASVSSFPIYWMTTFDGWVADRHGRTAMLVTDGLAGVAGGVLLLLAALVLLRRGPGPAPVPTGPDRKPGAQPSASWTRRISPAPPGTASPASSVRRGAPPPRRAATRRRAKSGTQRRDRPYPS